MRTKTQAFVFYLGPKNRIGLYLKYYELSRWLHNCSYSDIDLVGNITF